MNSFFNASPTLQMVNMCLGGCLVTRRLSFMGVGAVQLFKLCCVAPRPH